MQVGYPVIWYFYFLFLNFSVTENFNSMAIPFFFSKIVMVLRRLDPLISYRPYIVFCRMSETKKVQLSILH